MGMLSPNLRPDLDALRVDVAVAALRDVVKDGWSVLSLSTGMADALTDQAGIASLGGASYDGSAKTLANPGGYTALVPVMTGQSSPSGTVTDDSGQTGGVYAAYKGFDADASTRWARASVGQAGWLAYDWGTGNGKSVVRIALQAASSSVNEMPKTWTLDGWNGASWVTVFTSGTETAWSSGESRTYTFANGASYQKYRVNIITSQDGLNCSLGNVQMYSTITPAAVTVVSNAFALGFQPSAARIVAPVDLGGGVIGTDCMLDLSRDGTTWSAVPLSDLGKFDASTRIVGGLVNLAGQPAGSSIYWRWRTASGIAQALHGVWLQCK